LRTLAGVNEAQPDLRQWGEAVYDGQPLDRLRRPALVHQSLKHYVSTVRENLTSAFPDRRTLRRADQDARIEALLEWSGVWELAAELAHEAVSLSPALQRLLSVLRAFATQAPLVCLDETTANTDEACAERVMGLMRRYAHQRAVLFVTHNQQHAQAVADHCALLGGGRIVAAHGTDTFFRAQPSELVRHFVATSSVNLPSPGATPETLAEDAPPPPPLPPAALEKPSQWVGPRGFRWLWPGRLGGLPRPGIVAPLEEDLLGLKRLGVALLVTLEETPTVDAGALEAHGLRNLHFPVPDMEAPSAADALALCGKVQGFLDSDEPVALHCRAGMGRTGTLLAAQLIFSGVSAVDALERVRSINPKWVQSEAQVRFLEDFADVVRVTRPIPTPAPTALDSPS
jgi:atypical dual specificity phosphatase